MVISPSKPQEGEKVPPFRGSPGDPDHPSFSVQRQAGTIPATAVSLYQPFPLPAVAVIGVGVPAAVLLPPGFGVSTVPWRAEKSFEHQFVGHAVAGEVMYRLYRQVPGLKGESGEKQALAAGLAFGTMVAIGEAGEVATGADAWSPGDVVADGAGVLFAVLDEAGVLKNRVSYELKWPAPSHYRDPDKDHSLKAWTPWWNESPYIVDLKIKMDGIGGEKCLTATKGMALIIGVQHVSRASPSAPAGPYLSWSSGAGRHLGPLPGAVSAGWESYWPDPQRQDEAVWRVGLEKDLGLLEVGGVVNLEPRKPPGIGVHAGISAGKDKRKGRV